MPRKKTQDQERTCGRSSYDIDGWEGGIAVYWVDGDYGTRIVAVPKLMLSTCLMNDVTDSSRLTEMLIKDRSLYHDQKQIEYLVNCIMRDIKGLKAV